MQTRGLQDSRNTTREAVAAAIREEGYALALRLVLVGCLDGTQPAVQSSRMHLHLGHGNHFGMKRQMKRHH